MNRTAIAHKATQARYEKALADGRATLEREQIPTGYKHSITLCRSSIRITKFDFDRLRATLDLRLESHGINGSNRHFECFETRQ